MNVFNSRKARKFGHDNSGTIAILFGLLVIPIVLSIALAVDYSRVQTAHRDLQQAVDSAAIAAAVYQMNKKAEWDTFTDNGKSIKQVAFDYVRKNAATQHMDHIIPDARQNSSDNTLTVTAKATVPATFSRFVLDKFNIEVKATARMSGKTAKLCMMGLHRSVPEAVKAWGSAVLVAPDCAVVSNSEATNSLSVGGSASMSGEAFCSAGGVVGTAYDPRRRKTAELSPTPTPICIPRRRSRRRV